MKKKKILTKKFIVRLLLICTSFVVLGCGLLYSDRTSSNIKELTPFTYNEFEETLKESNKQEKQYVNLEFVESQQNLTGEVKYKYKIKPNEPIELLSKDTYSKYYDNDYYFNEYILSDKKLDIQKDRTYEGNFNFSIIEYPSYFIREKSPILPSYYDKEIITTIKEIDTNQIQGGLGKIDITIPIIEKNNKIDYEFIKMDLKMDIYEKYVDKFNELKKDKILQLQREMKYFILILLTVFIGFNILIWMV